MKKERKMLNYLPPFSHALLLVYPEKSLSAECLLKRGMQTEEAERATCSTLERKRDLKGKVLGRKRRTRIQSVKDRRGVE